MENNGDHQSDDPDYDEILKRLDSIDFYSEANSPSVVHSESCALIKSECLGESSKSTPLHSNSINRIDDEEPMSQRLLAIEDLIYCPPNMQYNYGFNSTYDPNFASTSSAPPSKILLNSLPGSNGYRLQGFGYIPFNPIRTSINGISVQDYQLTINLIQNRYLLYECVCNGSAILQRLINNLRNWGFLLQELIESLSIILVRVACNPNGRRVIVNCFPDVEPSLRSALDEKIVEYCLELATDKSGCIFVNSCIPLMEKHYKELLLSIICDHAPLLAKSYYGTYVVQYLVSAEHVVYTPRTVRKIASMFPVLSTHKEGSHLVERCIQSYLTREMAVQTLVELGPAELQSIARNEYGNFVIQKALISTKDSPQLLRLHLMLRTALTPLLRDPKVNKFGKKVASKLQKGNKH